MSRREVQFRSPSWGNSGVDLTVTRKGVELGGHYDGGYGGMEGFAITWEELELARAIVRGRDADFPVATAIVDQGLERAGDSAGVKVVAS